MRWSSFVYLFGQGLRSMFANRVMALASLGVLIVCMLITGFTGLLTVNVNSLMDWLGSQNEMVAMLDRSLSEEDYQSIGKQILGIAGVEEAEYISKADALNQMSGEMGEYAELFSELEGEENPLYAQYNIRITDPAQTAQIIEQVEGVQGVEIVHSPESLIRTFLNVQRWVQFISWGLVIVLGVVSSVVISNTIRLTVFARRREINIMKFVGATNGFIRMPFFVEGMTVGLLAGLISTGIVLGGYHIILQKAMLYFQGWEDVVQQVVLPVSELWPWVLAGFSVFGLVLGSIGTMASMRKYLDV